MSTALRKQEPVLPDPHETETATETMMAYIGYLNTEVMKEEDKPKPNMLKIQALQDQMDAVSKERKLITPSNKKLIAKAIYVYAPIMKAIDV